MLTVSIYEMTEYTNSITLNDSYLSIRGTHVLIVTYVNKIYTLVDRIYY